jgi:hypothetical protein
VELKVKDHAKRRDRRRRATRRIRKRKGEGSHKSAGKR